MPQLEFEALNDFIELNESTEEIEFSYVYGQATWVSCLLTDKPDIGCYPVMPY